jgi:hypothetical protein
MAMLRSRRIVGAVLGLLYLAENAFAGYVLIFLATFPFENVDPKDRAGDDWLIAVGLLLGAFALILAIAVAARSSVLAGAMLALNSAITVSLLVWGLEQSDHSDGMLVALAFAVEATGAAAVFLSSSRGS